ncbi:hypothetical protein J4573_08310 [Actinomadura barringtoniae]|uniref:Uncharacterized protein n=1 Tax=Actinomadura barringtoniae TaxID=1427535 RepID=A0A939P7M8_9ACTN|nr:hypothetical protein [Actinomadura barringtoniae]MBO2447088.1 hypothetical protein [Actinomadura barringtoniae]
MNRRTDLVELESLQVSLDERFDHYVHINFDRFPTNFPEIRKTLAHLEAFIRAVALAQFVADAESRGAVLRERDIKRMTRQIQHETNRIYAASLNMNSPLILEMIIPAGSISAITGVLVYMAKNPQKLGEWWPTVQTAYYNAQREKLKARRALEKMERARPVVDARPLNQRPTRSDGDVLPPGAKGCPVTVGRLAR